MNLLVTAGFPRGARAPVGGSAETVMNPSVADTERYSLIYEATDEVNGKTYRSLIPVLVFKDLVSAWKHMLFTVVLATLRKPRENANIVAKAIDSIAFRVLHDINVYYYLPDITIKNTWQYMNPV